MMPVGAGVRRSHGDRHMTTTLANAIVAFESPNAFIRNPSARQFWNSHVKSRVNGWGLIELECHRIQRNQGQFHCPFRATGE